MCFQYAVTLALNHDKINREHQSVSKIRSYINEYN